MSGNKFLIIIATIFFTIITGVIIFFGIFSLFSICKEYLNPYPEHPTMPTDIIIYSFILTIPISILISIKIHKWLK